MVATLTLLDLDSVSRLEIPLAPVPASCGFTGFPSPAQDYTDKWITLDEYLDIHDCDTWYFTADGNSMEGLGIQHGDILIVDSAATAVLGDICICLVEGEYTAKIVDTVEGKPALISANKDYPPVFVEELTVFGVVTGRVTRFRRPGRRGKA